MTSFVDRVSAAAQAMRMLFPETPLQLNDYLSHKYGAHIWLKREDLSPVRSYKISGAFNFFRKELADGKAPELFVCASAGNHAQGFAFVCRHFGKSGVVFMPVTTPQQKIDKTRSSAANSSRSGLSAISSTTAIAQRSNSAEASGGHMVPPFDHMDIIEGQATVAMRSRRSCRKPQARHHDPAGRRRRAFGWRYALFRGAGNCDTRFASANRPARQA